MLDAVNFNLVCFLSISIYRYWQGIVRLVLRMPLRMCLECIRIGWRAAVRSTRCSPDRTALRGACRSSRSTAEAYCPVLGVCVILYSWPRLSQLREQPVRLLQRRAFPSKAGTAPEAAEDVETFFQRPGIASVLRWDLLWVHPPKNKDLEGSDDD